MVEIIERSAWSSRGPARTPPAIDEARVESLTSHYFGEHAVGAHGYDDEVSALESGVISHHIDTQGWADAGYTWAIGQSGRVYEVRGRGRRPAAQGTEGNRVSYAVVFIIGGDEQPTSDALAAYTALHAHMEAELGRSLDHRLHRDWMSRPCPGPHIDHDTLASGDGQEPGDRTLTIEDPYMEGDDVAAIQDALRELGYDAGDSGVWGPSTAEGAAAFARDHLDWDGDPDELRFGPRSVEALREALAAHRDDTDEEEEEDDPMPAVVLYARRGTPDLAAAFAAASATGQGAVTCDADWAAEVVEAGGKVLAVGGPAADDLPDAEEVSGSHATSTLLALAEEVDASD